MGAEDDTSFMDEQARLEADELAQEQREMAAMTEAEREDYLADKAERAAKKDTMLRSQLGVYGKNPVLNSRGKGRKNKSKKSNKAAQQQAHEEEEDDQDDGEASDGYLDEGAEPESMSRRKAQRQKELDMERETRRALKHNKKNKKHQDIVDVQAEERRQSRLRKLRDLQRELDESDDESTVQSGSLLDRLRGPRGSRRARRAATRSEDLDDTPLPISLWVFLIFAIVAFDRAVKFLLAHANPVVMSKILGGVLIAGSFGVKVPQIASIIEAKTVKGMSTVKSYTAIQALILIVAYSLANKHPFTSWGDSLSVLVQEIIIVGLMWTYGDTSIYAQAALTVGFLAFAGAVASYTMHTRPEKLWALPMLSSAISLTGTVPQILENYVNRHTGPLSFVTQLMVFLGVLTRVFTTLTEVNDPIVLGSFVLSSVVNGILLAQIFAYWANTKHVLAKEAKKRRKSSKVD